MLIFSGLLLIALGFGLLCFVCFKYDEKKAFNRLTPRLLVACLGIICVGVFLINKGLGV